MAVFDLRRIQREHKKWSARNFGEDVPTWHPLLGVVEEIGELCHAHLKEAQGIRTNEDHIANAKDAVGDTVIYLIDYCNRRGFDFADILLETWKQVRARDWIKNPEIGKAV